MDGWMDELMDGWMDGWMGVWLAGWIDGLIGGWMDRVSGKKEERTLLETSMKMKQTVGRPMGVCVVQGRIGNESISLLGPDANGPIRRQTIDPKHSLLLFHLFHLFLFCLFLLLPLPPTRRCTRLNDSNGPYNRTRAWTHSHTHTYTQVYAPTYIHVYADTLYFGSEVGRFKCPQG